MIIKRKEKWLLDLKGNQRKIKEVNTAYYHTIPENVKITKKHFQRKYNNKLSKKKHLHNPFQDTHFAKWSAKLEKETDSLKRCIIEGYTVSRNSVASFIRSMWGLH